VQCNKVRDAVLVVQEIIDGGELDDRLEELIERFG